MKEKFNLGIEISNSVLKSSTPNEIRRYGVPQKIKVNSKKPVNNKVYRYRPGVNSFMTGDLDV